MSKLQAPIGIYGGTFDPIHYGHLRVNLELCELLDLDHVRFIPAFLPPHKGKLQSTARQRVEMVAQAIASESRFILDDREIQREGMSYMVDTLSDLRQEYPESPLYLLMGMDAFAGIDQWYEWQELLTYAHIIISHRPDVSAWSKRVSHFYQTHQTDSVGLQSALCGKIKQEVVTQLAISATDIRNRRAKKQSIRFLMPDSVINLIKYYNLYS
jgi:nicotinate-nucleotide adenylyltransferase